MRTVAKARNSVLRQLKEIPHDSLVVHRHVQTAARDTHVGVPCGVPDIGQRSPPGQGVADECVAPVMVGQRLEPTCTKNRRRGSISSAWRWGSDLRIDIRAGWKAG